MIPISALYPGPITVTVAGRPRRIDEITIGDVIELQRWLDARAPRPLDDIRDGLDAMTTEDRKAALWDAWDILDKPAVVWGSGPSNELFATGEGIVEIFRVILGHHYPKLARDHDAVLGLVEQVARESPGDYAAMRRAWRRLDPQEEVEIMLEQWAPTPGKEIGWPESILETCGLYGWTLDYVATLPYSAFVAARSMGRPRERGTSVAPRHGGLKELVRFRKAQYEERARNG